MSRGCEPCGASRAARVRRLNQVSGHNRVLVGGAMREPPQDESRLPAGPPMLPGDGASERTARRLGVPAVAFGRPARVIRGPRAPQGTERFVSARGSPLPARSCDRSPDPAKGGREDSGSTRGSPTAATLWGRAVASNPPGATHIPARWTMAAGVSRETPLPALDRLRGVAISRWEENPVRGRAGLEEKPDIRAV